MRPEHLMTCYQKVTYYYIHVKNVQKLMIEFYKYLYDLSPPIMTVDFTNGILKYKLQNCRVTLLPNPRIKKYGTDKIACKASQVWSTLPRYKNLSLLDLFKSEIKNWPCSDCP